MNHPAVYTPLESLLLFQSLLVEGVDFPRISEQLKNNALIKSHETYDAARLNPDALQQLFLQLLREEIKLEADRASANDDGSGAPGSRKRKLGSPSLPSLKNAIEHIEKIPALVDRLYARYRDHTVSQIRDDERRFDMVQGEIQFLERKEGDYRAKAANQNSTPVLAPKDSKPLSASSGPSPSGRPITGTPAGLKSGLVQNTPVIPPKPLATTISPSPVAPPSHLPPNLQTVRPPASPKPPNGSGSVLQAPAGVPQSGPRPLQPPPQQPKQAISPRPEPGVLKTKDATVPQAATPTAGTLKWEKPYQPPQAAQAPSNTPNRQFHPTLPQHSHVAPAPQQTQQQQQWFPQPTSQYPSQAPGTPTPSHPQAHAPPQARSAPGKAVLVPPQNAGQLAPPLQPGPPRPTGGHPVVQAHPRPTSTTPVRPPGRPIQPQQSQIQPHQVPRPIAASPAPPTGASGPIAPPQRWPQAYPPQHAQPSLSSSPAPVPPQKDKLYSSPYVSHPPKPAIPEHIIRQAISTPGPGKRLSSASTTPHTPASSGLTSLTRGFGTKWASHSTPSTPGPLVVEPASPAFEPFSPPLRPVAPPDATPRPGRKKPASKSAQKTESAATKSGRVRAPRTSQKGRGVSATPPARRSQSVVSHADEPSMDHSELAPIIKDEEATPRPTEDAGDTTADESVPGKPRTVTPGRDSLRIPKRKRQDSIAESLPPPSTQVLWTRGFTKVSSSALDQISSHRDANMFATALRERDAPNYRQIVLQPQDITSIRSAIKHGNKAAVQAASSLPGGDPGTAHVWLPFSEELVPPKGIVNSAQLERELVHMFCNAIMYNPDPDRGPGPAFMKRSQDEEEEIVGYHLDENGVVKNTRSMFMEVEKLLGDLRSAEKERSQPPPSAVRPASVATPADDTADDEDELAGDGEPGSGTAKRRRVGTKG